jgi:hypothetical protein
VCRAVSSTWRLKSSHRRTQAGLCSQAQGVYRKIESEGCKAKLQAEAQANSRWPSALTTRQQNGEVSYETYGSDFLRGSVLRHAKVLRHGGVQKEAEDVGGD